MAPRITSLKHGDKVRLHCGGSKQFGNDPYELETIFLGITGYVKDEDGEDTRRAVFEDMQAYRFRGRWVYGSGAMPLTVVERI